MKTNPLNIRVSNELFRGELKTTGKFKVFINQTYGVRAALKIIYTYITKYHLITVADIINRWAPPSENDTKSYILFVCDQAKLRPDSLVSSKTTFLSLIHAMALIESNTNLTNKCLLDAWNLTFV